MLFYIYGIDHLPTCQPANRRQSVQSGFIKTLLLFGPGIA